MTESQYDAEVKKLAELMKDIKFAMLTTVEIDGTLRSRPMATQEVEFDGDLWFFTAADAPKVDEVNEDHHVNVAFSDPSRNRYISVSGTASLTRDPEKIKELWKPAYKTFFPKGLEDPNLSLIKVVAESAEYWDSPGTSVGRAFSFLKAYATKDPSALGDHAKIQL